MSTSRKAVEIYFNWTCPACNHAQQDSVNAEQGPYLSLTCGKCEKAFEVQQLSEVDGLAWDDALYQAEIAYLGTELVAFANDRDYTSADLLGDAELLRQMQKEMEARNASNT